jgi:hypothetical protein
LSVADDATAGDGDLLCGAGELKAVEVDDRIVERSDITVEKGLGAELATDGSIAGDDTEYGRVLREDEAIVEVDGLGEDACDRSADVQVRGAGDADAERNTNWNGAHRRRGSLS